MTCRLRSVSIAAQDPAALARFWAALLPHHAGFELTFRQTSEPKTGPNIGHFDLTTHSLEEQDAMVQRALGLGARHHDVGQNGDEGHVVLADPEGNEFCVIEPSNAFLVDTGPIGALSCDGTRAVGHFWSAALGWPLVWDQDEETAIQAPNGGPKVSWSGHSPTPRVGETRLRLDLVADDPSREVARLLGLGAARADLEPDQGHVVPLVDPDGNEFFLYPTETAIALLEDSA